MDKKGLIQGYVVLRKNGEIVYDDYNTITSKGREFILATIISQALSTIPNIGNGATPFLKPSEDESQLSAIYSLSGIGFGYGTGDVYSQGDATISVVEDYLFDLTDDKHVKDLKVDFESNYIKYTVIVNATDTLNIAVSELGLYLTKIGSNKTLAENIESDEAILFSRISFDPIPMVPSTNLTLDYYIYF